MSGVRALVQRPRRKMHLAALDVELGCWFTFCDRAIVADAETAVHRFDAIGGATRRLVTQLRGIVASRPAGSLCAHCSRFVMLIALLEADQAHGVLAEYRRAA